MKKFWRKSASLALAIAMAGTLMSSAAFAQEAGGAAETADTYEAAETADVSGTGTDDTAGVAEADSADVIAEDAAETADDAAGDADASSEGSLKAAAAEEAEEDAAMSLMAVPDTSEMTQIGLNESVEVTIETAGGSAYLLFTPEESGTYRFYSTSDEYYDTYGYLLDTAGNQLTYNDDGGENFNFQLVYNCTAGISYIIRAEFLSDFDTGSFTVTAEEYDVSDIYNSCGDSLYASEGDSLTLEARANDYWGNAADLSGDSFSFNWYRYDATTREMVGLEGSTSSYTIDSLTSGDFYQTSAYNYYICYIYKNGTQVAATNFYIYNIDLVYYTGRSSYYNFVGESVTLSFTMTDYYGNSVDLSDSAFTYEWYKELDYYDSTTGSWVYDTSDILGMESTYTIDSLADDDFYVSSLSQYNQFYCRIYKNGTLVATVYYDIYNADYYYYTYGSSYYKSEGDSVTLSFTLRDYDGNAADLSDSAFTYEWYKYQSGTTTTVDCTESTYTIDSLTDDDLYPSSSGQYNSYQCRIYKNGTQVATAYCYIYNKDMIYYAYSSSYYKTVGDSVTLSFTLRDYDGNAVDLSDSAFTYQWYKYDSSYGTTTVNCTESTYTIDSLTDDDFYQSSASQYSYYKCTIYKNGTEVETAYCYIYNTDMIYYTSSTSYYKSAGEAVTLSFTMTDYDGSSVDLSDSAFTYEWYKELDYYDSTTGSWVYDTSDILGTESAYTIDSLASDDFYQSAASIYNQYYCRIYKNGTRVATVWCYIYDADNYYYTYSSSYYKSAGDSATLSFTLRDYDGNAVDLSDSAFTYEWYKYVDYYDSATDTWVYETSDVLSTDSAYTIDSLADDDFYMTGASQYNRYYCEIYKNGATVATAGCYIYNKDMVYYTSSSSKYTVPGDSVTLSFKLTDYDGNTVSLGNSAFTYEWYKVVDNSTTGDVLGTDSTYTIDRLADGDFYLSSAEQYNYYRCMIYKDGVRVATVSCYIYNTDEIFYGSTQNYYKSSGESLTMEATANTYDGDTADLSGSAFTFEWYKVSSGYDADGNYYSTTSDVLGTGSTYSISSLGSDNFYDSSNSVYNRYYCYIYKNGNRVATSYYYIYNKDYYYYGYETVYYGGIGDSVTLEAQAYDYTDELADLSGSAFTFTWYRVIDEWDETTGTWTYEQQELENTGRTLTIGSLTEDDLCSYASDRYNHYYCVISKNGRTVAYTYMYIEDPDVTYSGRYETIYQSAGQLTLEAQAYDYTGELADLSGSAFTFEWYKYSSGYDESGEYYAETSDVIGTGQTYTIDSVSSEDLYASRQWNYYYCYIYKNGTRVATYYCHIYPAGDTLCVRRGNTFYFSYALKGGNADLKITAGKDTDQVLVGDWDGDGVDTICLRRGNKCYFIDNITTMNVYMVTTYGREDDEVLVGDWDGDGKDSLAMRRKGNVYYFCNDIEDPDADTWRTTYGRITDEILVGDWEDSGYDSLAARRNGNIYYFSLSMVTEPNGDVWRTTFGRATDEVLVGDWDNDGDDSLAMRRNGNVYYISNSISNPDAGVDRFTFGRTTDEVYAGKWLGN